jgi:lycopene cyclase CruP
MTLTETILGQLPGNVFGGLERADRLWRSLKENQANPASVTPVISQSSEPLDSADWDVVICGGTLGIFIGTALALQGWRVALLERGQLRGRQQEWNISRSELAVLSELNILTDEEVEKAIATQYNPARIQFTDGPEFWVEDILNLGVDPVYLLDALKSRFLTAGGKLFEQTPFSNAVIHPNGAIVQANVFSDTQQQISGAGGAGGSAYFSSQGKSRQEKTFKTRLILDVMGHFSPIVRQVRQGQKPDGICLVVGTCAKGFPKNDTGDLMVSFTPIKNQCQYFWEAFPAKDGRTTYLFTYLDADPNRINLTDLFEDYFRLLPEYQNVSLEQLEFVRALFGFFPSYRQSPLRSPWNRLLFIGDSSGAQSPLSFGGFGAMLRHLKRLSKGINEALKNDRLDQSALAQLMPYQPNLSVTWLFQRAMMVKMGQTIAPNQINQLLSGVFQCMADLGDPVLKPFLQDVVQFGGLSKTLFKTSISQPGLVFKIIPQVGIPPLIDWMQHYINLGLYSALSPMGQSLTSWVNRLPVEQQYYWRRAIETWTYGSGLDNSDRD